MILFDSYDDRDDTIMKYYNLLHDQEVSNLRFIEQSESRSFHVFKNQLKTKFKKDNELRSKEVITKIDKKHAQIMSEFQMYEEIHKKSINNNNPSVSKISKNNKINSQVLNNKTKLLPKKYNEFLLFQQKIDEWNHLYRNIDIKHLLSNNPGSDDTDVNTGNDHSGMDRTLEPKKILRNTLVTWVDKMQGLIEEWEDLEQSLGTTTSIEEIEWKQVQNRLYGEIDLILSSNMHRTAHEMEVLSGTRSQVYKSITHQLLHERYKRRRMMEGAGVVETHKELSHTRI